MPLVQRRAQQVCHGREPTAAHLPHGPDYPARVTSYSLRSASPAKTRCDAVVVGVLQSAKGPELADRRRRRRRGLRPQAAPAARDPRRHRQGRRGRQDPDVGHPRHPAAGAGRARQGRTTTTAVRRAAGVAARAVTNAVSVAVSLPAGSPELVRAVTEGYELGAYTFTTYKNETPDTGARRGRGAQPGGAQAGRRHGVRAGPHRRRGRDLHPRLGQHPSRRPDAAGLRRPGRRGDQAADQGPRRAQGLDPGARRRRARRARLRRHPRGRRRVGRSAAPGRAHLRACRAPRATSRWSARASPSTPAG